MMKCYSLLLGARNTPSGTRRFSAADEERVRRITFQHFPGGFTVLNADGGWFDPERRSFVKEQSRQILVCARRLAQLRPWCDELLRALGQKELLVIEIGPAHTFVCSRPPRRTARGAAPRRHSE